MARTKVSREQVIQALEATGGMVTYAAKKLGVNWSTVYRYIQKDPILQEKLKEIQESRLDLAETKLMEAVKKGRSWAICFYLKCIGKPRGYIEKQQLEHSIENKGEPVTLNVKFNFVKTHGEKVKEKPVPSSSD